MYHSVTFGTKNTWDDWHIIPTTRPIFKPPPLKEKILEIPGGDGIIDLSESLTGYPVYGNREGSMEFVVMNGYGEWFERYSDIMDYLHGQRMTVVLEDDIGYSYSGRFKVNDWKSSANYSSIVIDYSVEPYKWSRFSSIDEWLWNTFNFSSGIITTAMFKNIPVTTVEISRTYEHNLLGRAPVCPSFIVDTTSQSGVNVRFINTSMNIDVTKLVPDGTSQIPEFLFYGGTVNLRMSSVSGTGTVSLDFRQGRL